MKRILTMDAHDYPAGLKEIRRTAARAVIFLDGKLLLTENDFGEVKLPGGGIEPGEDDVQALIREVREETGCAVIPASIRPFGEIEEKRLSQREDAVWHQFSRIYFCRVESARFGECSYSEGEKRLGFRPVVYSLEEAIKKNEAMLDREGKHTYNQREHKTLLLIRERLEKTERESGHGNQGNADRGL